jgi:beta-galactosidase
MLNISWNRNYKAFDDVELPKTRNTFNDIIDWRMFFVHTIGENVKRRFEVAKAEDRGKHPLMCHHVFIQGFPVTSTANDPWNVGRFGDLHGFTQMDDMAMIDILRSCAKDKPVISAEMLMLPGYTLDLPKTIDADDIKKFIFSGVAGNQKGFIFWQYRPEILGRETPTWGLSYLDGNETSWLKSFSDCGKVLQKNAEFILDAKPQKAQVAILYNPENQIFAWASTGNEKTSTDSLLGFHRALYERNFVVDFIHPIEFEKDILSNYNALIIPFPYVINTTIAERIKTWVENGGVVISESYTAGWNIENGHHEKIVPGYGLDKVFKVKQTIVEPVGEKTVKIRIEKDLPFIKKGEFISGAIVKELFYNNGTKVLAEFECGNPAIRISGYGKGKAIQIGSYISLVYQRTHEDNNGRLLSSLVEYSTNIQRPIIKEDKKVRVDVLSKNEERMVIIQNLESEDIEVTVKLPDEKFRLLKEQFSGSELKCKSIGAGVEMRVKLYPREVRVYRA